jgi:hypothetical protein
MGLKMKHLYIAILVVASVALVYFLGKKGNKEGLENQTSTETTSTNASATTSSASAAAASASPPTTNSSNNQDNYNHFTGTAIPTMFYGPNGSVAKISSQGGAFSIIVTDKDGKSMVYDEQNKSHLTESSLAAIDAIISRIMSAISANASSFAKDPVTKYYGPNNSVAIMYTDHTGNSNLRIIDSNGKEISYNSVNMQSYNPSIDNQYVPQMPGTTSSPSNYMEAYNNSLPKGIPKSMIPPGNEDLYILKSEVVPPVCPACPQPILKCNDNKPPPPCPPCARCPEPRFDCKKVPNYGSGDLGANYFGGGGQFGSMPSKRGDFLPYPALTDYTTFGN